jgi:hypothetical protein
MARRVVALNEPSRAYAAGRVCAAPDCGTRLSVYNPLRYCALHAALRSRSSARGVSVKPTPRSDHES